MPTYDTDWSVLFQVQYQPPYIPISLPLARYFYWWVGSSRYDKTRAATKALVRMWLDFTCCGQRTHAGPITPIVPVPVPPSPIVVGPGPSSHGKPP